MRVLSQGLRCPLTVVSTWRKPPDTQKVRATLIGRGPFPFGYGHAVVVAKCLVSAGKPSQRIAQGLSAFLMRAFDTFMDAGGGCCLVHFGGPSDVLSCLS